MHTTQNRHQWELVERIAELEAQLAENVERDRIRELEITALRNELQLRFAYNEAAERTGQERLERIKWLEAHIESVVPYLTASLEVESNARRTAETLLAAERARISYRVTQLLLRPTVRRRSNRG